MVILRNDLTKYTVVLRSGEVLDYYSLYPPVSKKGRIILSGQEVAWLKDVSRITSYNFQTKKVYTIYGW